MVHTAQLSVSMCVSVALSLFSGFRVEQTLLKHTGPHAYTNTINSGACLHLHLFPDQKTHTYTQSRTRTHHTQTAFLWGTQMLKVLWVLFISVLRHQWIETPFICLIYCVKSSLPSHCVHRSASYTCPQITFLHGLAGVFTSFLTHYLHIMPERKWVALFSDPFALAGTWFFQTESSLRQSDKIKREKLNSK